MINADKRKAIYCLHNEGIGKRTISRQLKVSRNIVRNIIEQRGEMPYSKRSDKIQIDSELITKLFLQCDGYVQRIHEKLIEEHGQKIGYSTLTRLIRDSGLKSGNDRCHQEPDQPGAEMQHDTTTHRVQLGDKRIQLVASILYFRYSKVRYLKFYPSFKRFKMKCFLHEALTFLGYAAPVCIIDNTNLARLYGSGKRAVIVPEMEQFATQYGFEFECHELNHPNRKAGNERSFYTVETNFYPGRKFTSLEDLNRQGLEWSTIRMAHRPVGKSRLIPSQMFEYEKPYLVKLPPFVSAPYIEDTRGTDQYGYISFDGNYYWVPGTKRFDVKVLEYDSNIKLYRNREFLVDYSLAPYGVKNKKFFPPGYSKPRYQPKNRRRPTDLEEKKLRNVDPQVDAYINVIFEQKTGKERHAFIRRLYRLYRKTASALFVKTIQRSLKYRIMDTEIIASIAALLMKTENYQMPQLQENSEFRNRQAWSDGRMSEDVDWAIYEKLMESEDE